MNTYKSYNIHLDFKVQRKPSANPVLQDSFKIVGDTFKIL